MDFEQVRQQLSNEIKTFTDEQIQCISQCSDEAIEFFHDGILNDLNEGIKEEDWRGYYALVFLPYLKDPAFFDLLIQTLRKDHDYLNILGDLVTELFPCLLLEAYNNEYDTIQQIAMNHSLESVSRNCCILVAFQLYKQQRITHQQLDELIHRMIDPCLENPSRINDDERIIIGTILDAISKLQLKEYQLLVRTCFEKDIIDPWIEGDYPGYISRYYSWYQEDVVPPFNIHYVLSKLRLYKLKHDPIRNDVIQYNQIIAKNKTVFEKYMNDVLYPKAKAIAIGRNDPCPCGSGKKYKKCCLPKGISFTQSESLQQRAMHQEVRDYLWNLEYVLAKDPLTNSPTIFPPKRIRRTIEEDYDEQFIKLDYFMGLSAYSKPLFFEVKIRNQVQSYKKVYAEYCLVMIREMLKENKIKKQDYIIRYRISDWIENVAKPMGLFL